MRILQLHCDYIEYAPVKKEIEMAEDDAAGGRLEEVLVAFVSVEKGDGAKTAQRAVSGLRESLKKIGCSRLLIYPYVHLSSNLARPTDAIAILKEMRAHSAGLDVYSAPFGWTKSYTLKVKGHPLAEGSRTITEDARADARVSKAIESESKIESNWYVLNPDGTMIEAAKFDYTEYGDLERLARYESAKVRASPQAPPHVALMKKMAIADYEPASDSGNMRFYPNGRLIKSLIEQYVTGRIRRYGGYEVETPIMYDSDHPSMASYFDRFPARQYNIDSEGRRLFLRFAACFGQFLMVNDFQMSYRNLPYRLYELTRYSFRREQSGELVGLRRLRAFTMPDCHAFCADMKQAITELQKRFELSRDVMDKLGICRYEMAIRLTEDFYRENGEAVRGLAAKHGKPVLVEMWKKKFFYFVLKWEFNYVDAAGKASALSTDQIDIENAGRYGIKYTDEGNAARNPVILHNSPSGAIERVIYALLEEASLMAKGGTKPELPLWLAPTQVRLIPLRAEHAEYCTKVADSISAQEIRADVDDRPESISRRIRDAEKEWIRYILVIGDKEIDSGRLNVRDRRQREPQEMDAEKLASQIREQTAGMPFEPLNVPFYLSRRPQIMV